MLRVPIVAIAASWALAAVLVGAAPSATAGPVRAIGASTAGQAGAVSSAARPSTAGDGRAGLPGGTFVVGDPDRDLTPDMSDFYSWRLGDARALEVPFGTDHRDEVGDSGYRSPASLPTTWRPTNDPETIAGFAFDADYGDQATLVEDHIGSRQPVGGQQPVRVVASFPISTCLFEDGPWYATDGSAAWFGCRRADGDHLMRIDLPFVDVATSLHDVTPAFPASLGGIRYTDVSPDGRQVVGTAVDDSCDPSAGVTTTEGDPFRCGRLVVAGVNGSGHDIVGADGAPVVDAGDPVVAPVADNEVAYATTHYEGNGVSRSPVSAETDVIALGSGVVTVVDPSRAGESITWSPDGADVAYLGQVAVPDGSGGTATMMSGVIFAPADASRPPAVATPLPPDTPAEADYYDPAGPLRNPSFLAWEPDPSTDVQLSLTAGSAVAATQGAPFTSTYSVADEGPSAATGVTLDVTPAALDPRSDLTPELLAAAGGTCTETTTGAAAQEPHRTYRCQLPDIAPGGSDHLDLTLSAALFGTYHARAVVRADQTDQRLDSLGVGQTTLAVSDRVPAPTTDGRIVYEVPDRCQGADQSGEDTYVAVDPDGSDPRTVLEVACTEEADLRPTVAAGYLWWLSADGYAGRALYDLNRVSLTTGVEERIATASDVVGDYTVSPDGAWIRGSGPDGFQVFPVADPTQIAPVAAGCGRIEPTQWLTGGTRFLCSDDGEFSVADTDGTTAEQATAVQGLGDGHDVVWGPDEASALVVGGYGPEGLDQPGTAVDGSVLRGLWRVDLHSAASGTYGGWTFLGPSDAGAQATQVSPTGRSVVYVDPDTDPHAEAPRLEVRSVSTTSPYEGAGVSVGIEAPDDASVRVVGWSDVAPVPGGTSTSRPLRPASPVVATGDQVATVSRLAEADDGIVGVSSDLGTWVEQVLSPGDVGSELVVHMPSGPPLSLGNVSLGSVAPDGAEVAVLPSAYGAAALPEVVDVGGDESTTTLPPLPDGNPYEWRGGTFVGQDDGRLIAVMGDGTVDEIDWRNPSASWTVVNDPDTSSFAALQSEPAGKTQAAISPDGRTVVWPGPVLEGTPDADHIVVVRLSANGLVASSEIMGTPGDSPLVEAVGSVADDGRVVVRTVQDSDDPGSDRVVATDLGGDLVSQSLLVVPVRPPSPVDPGLVHAVAAPSGIRLSPTGASAWYHLSSVAGAPSPCGEEALAYDRLTGGATQCVSEETPYRQDRAALAVPVGVADDGLALAETVYYQHGDGTLGIDLDAVRCNATPPAPTPTPTPTPQPAPTPTPARAPEAVRSLRVADLRRGRALVRWTLPPQRSAAPRTAVLFRINGRVRVLASRVSRVIQTGEKPGRRYSYAVATRGPGGRSAWVVLRRRRRG